MSTTIRRASKALLGSIPSPVGEYAVTWAHRHKALREPALLAGNYLLRARPREIQVCLPVGDHLVASSSDLIPRFLYVYGEWEPAVSRTLRQVLRPGDTFIDVGANIGYYSSLALTCVGDEGRVVAIEALPRFATALRDRLPTIDVAEVAVSDRSGTSTFHLPAAANGGTGSLSEDHGQGSVTVKTRQLDDLLSELSVTGESIRAIKIDVEGSEPQVLAGSGETLTGMAQGSLVLMEVRRPEEVMPLMERYGFRAHRVDNSYSPLWYASQGRWGQQEDDFAFVKQ